MADSSRVIDHVHGVTTVVHTIDRVATVDGTQAVVIDTIQLQVAVMPFVEVVFAAVDGIAEEVGRIIGEVERHNRVATIFRLKCILIRAGLGQFAIMPYIEIPLAHSGRLAAAEDLLTGDSLNIGECTPGRGLLIVGHATVRHIDLDIGIHTFKSTTAAVRRRDSLRGKRSDIFAVGERTGTDGRQRSGKHDLRERAFIESHRTDGSQVFGQIHRREPFAVLEGVIANRGHGRGQIDLRQAFAGIEGKLANGLHTFLHREGRKLLAGIEGTGLNRRHAGRDMNHAQLGAAAEGILADGRNGGRDVEGQKLHALVEGIVAYLRDAALGYRTGSHLTTLVKGVCADTRYRGGYIDRIHIRQIIEGIRADRGQSGRQLDMVDGEHEFLFHPGCHRHGFLIWRRTSSVGRLRILRIIIHLARTRDGKRAVGSREDPCQVLAATAAGHNGQSEGHDAITAIGCLQSNLRGTRLVQLLSVPDIRQICRKYCHVLFRTVGGVARQGKDVFEISPIRVSLISAYAASRHI